MVYYFQTFLLKPKATFKCIVKKLQDPSTVQQITLRSLTWLADSIKEVKHSRMSYENVCRPQKMTPEGFFPHFTTSIIAFNLSWCHNHFDIIIHTPGNGLLIIHIVHGEV